MSAEEWHGFIACVVVILLCAVVVFMLDVTDSEDQ